jgi:hypothetical protein
MFSTWPINRTSQQLQSPRVQESGSNTPTVALWVRGGGGGETRRKRTPALVSITKTNSVALSPQANYTDWATATCRRNLVPTFADRGVSCGQRGGSPTVVNLSFLDRSRYFSFKQLLIYPHKGWVDPVPDLLIFRKSGSSGNQTRDHWVRSQKLLPVDHRGGQWV